MFNAGTGPVKLTIAAAVPVPLSVTGEPATVALDVIVNVAGTAPAAVGENTTLIVQAPVAVVNVAPQVPPAAPAARAYRGDENASVIPVMLTVPLL